MSLNSARNIATNEPMEAREPSMDSRLSRLGNKARTLQESVAHGAHRLESVLAHLRGEQAKEDTASSPDYGPGALGEIERILEEASNTQMAVHDAIPELGSQVG